MMNMEDQTKNYVDVLAYYTVTIFIVFVVLVVFQAIKLNPNIQDMLFYVVSISIFVTTILSLANAITKRLKRYFIYGGTFLFLSVIWVVVHLIVPFGEL